MVFQDYTSFDNRTVEDNVAFGLECRGEPSRERREHARALLLPALAELPLAALQEKFRGKLARVTARGGAQGDDAAISFQQVAREIVLDRVAELIAGGAALYRPHDVRRLHRLRITAKRLRYALELSAKCWGEGLTEAAKEVARLQKSLGELHDCDVWAEDLGARLERLQGAGHEPPAGQDAPEALEWRAAHWLLEHFTRERTTHYLDALARWEAWLSSGFFAQLRAELEQTPDAE
jgi:CHAD domain-containing protein